MWALDIILTLVFGGLLTVLMIFAFGRNGPRWRGTAVLAGVLALMVAWVVVAIARPTGPLGLTVHWALFGFLALGLVVVLSAALPPSRGCDLPTRPGDLPASADDAAIRAQVIRRSTRIIVVVALAILLAVVAVAIAV